MYLVDALEETSTLKSKPINTFMNLIIIFEQNLGESLVDL